MFKLTVEESISTLILLEDLIECMEDEQQAYALKYVHDEMDYQLMDAFGLADQPVLTDETFAYLNDNLEVKVEYEVDELAVRILKAIFVPLLEMENSGLNTQTRTHIAKILFKIS